MEIKVENVMGSLGRNPNPAVAPQPPHLPPSPFCWPMDLTLTIAHSGHFLASPGLCPSTRRPTTAPLAAGPQEKLNLFLHPDISTERAISLATTTPTGSMPAWAKTIRTHYWNWRSALGPKRPAVST